MSDIDKNMLRDRAEKLDDVTEEDWSGVLQHNKDMMKEFLDANKHLSSQTVKQYTSALRIFFVYIKNSLGNKPLFLIKKRDFIKYFGFLQDNNLSSSALKFKRSAVSTLCKYIEKIVVEEEEDYKNFRNFTTAITDIPLNRVYDKIAISQEEYDKVMSVLSEEEDYLGMAWFATAFNVGARKSEIIQFKSEIADYIKEEGKNFIETHKVRGKGKSRDGKIIAFMVNDEAMKYIKLWLEKRGYEHEYIFTVKYEGEIKRMSSSWANHFCQEKISKIVGRRINPHLFKASCVTHLLEEGIDIKIVSKYIAHHESTETTGLYDLRDDSEAKNSIFK